MQYLGFFFVLIFLPILNTQASTTETIKKRFKCSNDEVYDAFFFEVSMGGSHSRLMFLGLCSEGVLSESDVTFGWGGDEKCVNNKSTFKMCVDEYKLKRKQKKKKVKKKKVKKKSLGGSKANINKLPKNGPVDCKIGEPLGLSKSIKFAEPFEVCQGNSCAVQNKVTYSITASAIKKFRKSCGTQNSRLRLDGGVLSGKIVFCNKADESTSKRINISCQKNQSKDGAFDLFLCFDNRHEVFTVAKAKSNGKHYFFANSAGNHLAFSANTATCSKSETHLPYVEDDTAAEPLNVDR